MYLKSIELFFNPLILISNVLLAMILGHIYIYIYIYIYIIYNILMLAHAWLCWLEAFTFQPSTIIFLEL